MLMIKMILKRVSSVDQEVKLLENIDSNSVDKQTLNWGYLSLGWYYLL